MKIMIYNYIRDNNKNKELQKNLEETIPNYYISESNLYILT